MTAKRAGDHGQPLHSTCIFQGASVEPIEDRVGQLRCYGASAEEITWVVIGSIAATLKFDSSCDEAVSSHDPFASGPAVVFAIAEVARLTHIWPMKPDDQNELALKRERRNAARFKREITEDCGGMLGVDEVRLRLSLPTVAAVREAILRRELFAVEDEGELRFPLIQFDGTNVRPGMTAILKAAPTTSGWRILQYLLRAEDGLAGDRPIDLIDGSAEQIDRAVRFASRLEH